MGGGQRPLPWKELQATAEVRTPSAWCEQSEKQGRKEQPGRNSESPEGLGEGENRQGRLRWAPAQGGRKGETWLGVGGLGGGGDSQQSVFEVNTLRITPTEMNTLNKPIMHRNDRFRAEIKNGPQL